MIRLEVKYDGISVDGRASHPRLQIRLLFEAKETTPKPSMMFLGFGTLEVLKRNVGSTIICQAYPEKILQRIYGTGAAVLVTYFADLDFYKLEVLERLREGSDLRLQLGSHIHVGSELNSMDELDITPMSSEGYFYRIARSDWCENFLPQLGYKKVRILEVPQLEPVPELKEAVDYVDMAWKKYTVGEYEDAVVWCRKTLDSISSFVKGLGCKKEETDEKVEKKEVPDWKKYFEGTETLDEAFEKVFRGVRSFTTPGAHPRRYSRSEAEFALMDTYSIANYVLRHYLRKREEGGREVGRD